MIDNHHLDFPPFLTSLKLELFPEFHYNAKFIIYFKNSLLKFLLFHKKTNIMKDCIYKCLGKTLVLHLFEIKSTFKNSCWFPFYIKSSKKHLAWWWQDHNHPNGTYIAFSSSNKNVFLIYLWVSFQKFFYSLVCL